MISTPPNGEEEGIPATVLEADSGTGIGAPLVFGMPKIRSG
jgi:hypothetical protein